MANSDTKPDVSLEAFSKVVEAVYDCALDPNRWHETVRLIADLLREPSLHRSVCTITQTVSATCRSKWVGTTSTYWRLHEEKYSRMNPFLHRCKCCRWVMWQRQRHARSTTEFLETRFYQEWVKPQRFARHDQFQGAADRTTHRLVRWPTVSRLHPRYGDVRSAC